MTAGTVAVLADDLIWASRLVAAVERTGASAARLTTLDALRTVLAADDEAELARGEEAQRLLGVIVDLNGRRYDGAEGVAAARSAGKPVIAVAEHDDQVTRRRALDAGAQRVFSYNKLFTDGPAVIGRWLGNAGDA
jgi:DNA-binding response OmpR family regulator